jgi:hypothetical protein
MYLPQDVTSVTAAFQRLPGGSGAGHWRSSASVTTILTGPSFRRSTRRASEPGSVMKPSNASNGPGR